MWTESALAHSIVVSNFYTEGKIIRPEILKEQQNAHLQTSIKQESNSKTMQVLSARGWGNTSSPVQDLFGLRKLYNLLWILNMKTDQS